MGSQTPTERRSKCKPWLIGLVVGAVTPTSCVIWGVRQRSWLLGIIPIAAVVAACFLYPPDQFNKLIRHSFQAGGGIIAFSISKTIKEDAIRNDKK